VFLVLWTGIGSASDLIRFALTLCSYLNQHRPATQRTLAARGRSWRGTATGIAFRAGYWFEQMATLPPIRKAKVLLQDLTVVRYDKFARVLRFTFLSGLSGD
jgi:hypothetical protein